MAISIRLIQEYCNPFIFEHGEKLYLNHKVDQFNERTNDDLGLQYISATVNGEEGLSYETTGIYRESDDSIYDYSCTCEAYHSYAGFCKHCVALFMKYCVDEQKGTQRISLAPVRSAERVKSVLEKYALKDKIEYMQPTVTGLVAVEPILYRNGNDYHLEFKIGMDTKYVIKNIDAFVAAFDSKEPYAYGKKLSFIHDMTAFDEESANLVMLIRNIVAEDQAQSKQIFRTKHAREYAHGKELKLMPRTLEQFLSLMSEKSFRYMEDGRKERRILLLSQNPDVYVKVHPIEDDGIQVVIPLDRAVCGQKHLYVFHEDVIYKTNPSFTKDMKELYEWSEQDDQLVLDLYDENLKAFCANLLPVLKRHCVIDEEEVDLNQYAPVEAVCKVYIEMTEQKEIVCNLSAHYGEESYPMVDGFHIKEQYRDLKKEGAVLKITFDYFKKDDGSRNLVLKEGEDSLYLLLNEGIARLNQVAQVFVDEKIKRMQVRKTPRIQLGVMLKQRMLELNMLTSELPLSEIHLLLDAYRRRKRFYRMRNGDFMQLEESSLEVLAELADGFHIPEEEMQSGKILLPRYRALYLDAMLKEHANEMEVHRDNQYKAMIREMRAVEDADYEVPESLQKILRSYQKTGYRFLRSLEHYGFGGILADDMGLGKTLQMIALLLAAKEEDGKEPSLIVAPASLIYNWKEELEKFAPSLTVGMVAGTAQARKKIILNAKKFDVVITSYDLLKRDIEHYKKISFHYEIIDEAQAIKNHTTQSAKAVKQIDSAIRFAMTGTPIENRLNELWSLFDYLMPGLLYSYQQFRDEIETPLVVKRDEVAMKRLQKLIKPFILRRLKKDVLKELPEKVENVIYTQLEEKQLTVYDANVQLIKKRLREQTPEEFKNTKLQTLAELTRLRQICCDPHLVYENYHGGASKIGTCLELIENAMDAGHKVLVFSQFTSMLAILEENLSKKHIDYYKLVGGTKKEERMRMVNRFQEDEVPVFLISLKAGGTGLNLTSANIVIHFDPWWNLAAENQATDRVHRIGQKQTVTVYKIIAKDTIEENIIRLQKRKKLLADEIISEQGVSVSEMTKDDLESLLGGE
ncbi:superfamily II DNA/RNA helicases, SNF2 family [Lachnospiraceae bacterium KM106-2]|nr:superfamily II DNA/RNA helicases, SNF2 family [Lachnospiraceae bacterium KM106-2]